MALTECPECKKQVSDKASSCPQCGAPIASTPSQNPATSKTIKKHSRMRLFLLLFLVLTGGLVFWLWRATTNDKAAPPSAGLAAAIRQPQKIVDERIELNEGQYASYSFRLVTDARVRVNVNAVPKCVDVMLMTKEESDKFQRTSGSLTGGKYTYRQALSSQQVLQMDKTEVLPAGEWSIIVLRPLEALLLRERTSASISVIVY